MEIEDNASVTEVLILDEQLENVIEDNVNTKLYFQDGTRRIHFVLGYMEPRDDGESEQNRKEVLQRRAFLESCTKLGLEFEDADDVSSWIDNVNLF